MHAKIEVHAEDPAWDAIGLDRIAQVATDAALRHLSLAPDRFEVSLLGCDDARIAGLNADFRGKPAPTNVLSWPSEARAAPVPGAMPAPPTSADAAPVELGDIALASGVCAHEAAAKGIAVADHVTHLTVHGVLHLLGFDHENDADAALMERLETEILASIGLPDPY